MLLRCLLKWSTNTRHCSMDYLHAQTELNFGVSYSESFYWIKFWRFLFRIFLLSNLLEHFKIPFHWILWPQIFFKIPVVVKKISNMAAWVFTIFFSFVRNKMKKWCRKSEKPNIRRFLPSSINASPNSKYRLEFIQSLTKAHSSFHSYLIIIIILTSIFFHD